MKSSTISKKQVIELESAQTTLQSLTTFYKSTHDKLTQYTESASEPTLQHITVIVNAITLDVFPECNGPALNTIKTTCLEISQRLVRVYDCILEGSSNITGKLIYKLKCNYKW